MYCQYLNVIDLLLNSRFCYLWSYICKLDDINYHISDTDQFNMVKRAMVTFKMQESFHHVGIRQYSPAPCILQRS